MIYTSYFANLRSIPEEIIPISICGKAPIWYTGLQYKKLAPKYEFFMEWKRNKDNNYYIEHFAEEVLKPLNKLTVLEEITNMANPKMFTKIPNIVLVCYEKPTDFCHRHLVANWLSSDKFKVKEWKSDG